MTSLTPHGEPPRYFTFPALAAAGLPHASTTRHFPGVTSPAEPTAPFTAEAREALGAVGLDLSRVAYARQMHGADVAHAITRGGAAGEVDVLSTRARRVPLAIFTADCLAITLWDAEAGALALAHVGRSEEHTSELQSRSDLVCRLLLEKKKRKVITCYWLKDKQDTDDIRI